jgi:alcohol dehydrogenase class IV
MQKIIEGIDKLQEILEIINCRKLFMVIDSSYPFLNIKDKIDQLYVTKICFSDFSPNPLFEDVCKGIDLFKAQDCDAILAVGGGSSIDVAKCIKLAVLAVESNDALIPPLVSKQVEIEGRRIPFIAIPTTAGTGSESTHNAVMYYQGAKQTVTNDGVLPDYALLEPKVLSTLPLYQKKCTMMDALCQGIESWWSVNSTDESKGYAKTAVELITKYWRKYIFDNDADAASKIMLAANYAGRAINISATTAAHAMSYKITSMYKLPHGHAVAVCLPEIWEYMTGHPEHCIDPRGKEYLLDIFGQISKSLSRTGPKESITFVRDMMKEMNMDHPAAVNREEELKLFTESVNPVRLKNNPVELTHEILGKLYASIIK